MTRPNIEQWAFAAILAAAAAPTLGQPQPAAGQAGAERADGQPAEASAELSSVLITGRHASRAEVKADPTGKAVLTASDLEAFDLRGTREVTRFSAGVYQPQTSFSEASSNYYIRGIGEPDGQVVPSTATFVDGVYLTRQLGSVQDLLDVQRVEVERGPVGFAGGHRAEGGAVRLTTLTPSNDVRRVVEAGYGTRNERRASLLFSGPLVEDTVYASIALGHRARDGVDSSSITGEKKNDIDYTAGRAKLRITPTSALDITLSASGSRDKSSNRAFADYYAADREATNNPVYPQASFTSRGFSANVSYRLNDQLRVEALSSTRTTDQEGYYDSSGSIYGQNASNTAYRTRDVQHELKLIGNYQNAEFSTGLYYLDEDWRQERRPNSVASVNLVNPALSTYRYFDIRNRQQTRDYGAFGQLKYRFSDALTGTFGLRYDHETYKNNPQLYATSAAATYPSALQNFLYGPVGALVWETRSRTTSRNLHPELAFSYALTPDLNVYAGYREGSRQGGYDFNSTSQALSTRAYDAEELQTYELGVKSALFDNRLWLNLGLFRNNFNNIQFTTYDAAGLQRRFNAGKAHSQGVELELRANPTPRLQVLYTATYIDSRLNRFSGTPGTALVNGQTYHTTPHVGAELPFNPAFQTTLGVSYQLPLATASTWRIAGDINYQGKVYADALNNALTRLPEQTYVNLLLGWTSADKHWNATLSARNLLDKRYRQRQSVLYASGAAYAAPTFYSDPASVFLSVKYSY